MKPFAAWGVGATVLVGCSAPPATPANPIAPATPATPAPVYLTTPAPAPVPSEAPPPAYTTQTVDLTVIDGPTSFQAGTTQVLVGRTLVPAGTKVDGLVLTAGQDSFTVHLGLRVEVPIGATDLRPMDVDIPFTPPVTGTYYLDGTRRFAVQVSSPAPSFANWGSSTGQTASFLDRSTYLGGAYHPSSVAPASVAASPAPMWGTVQVAAVPESGAVRGNPGVIVRPVDRVWGPTMGFRGQRLTWNATVWTAGDGDLRPDLVQTDHAIKVSFLFAPNATQAVSVPFPQQVQTTFSWTFKDPGQYALTLSDGFPLANVTID
jgi:hypothetical protein